VVSVQANGERGAQEYHHHFLPNVFPIHYLFIALSFDTDKSKEQTLKFNEGKPSMLLDV
jgi:hypothetical protein